MDNNKTSRWYLDELSESVCFQINDITVRKIKITQLNKYPLSQWLQSLRRMIGFLDEKGFCSLYDRVVFRRAYKRPEKIK